MSPSVTSGTTSLDELCINAIRVLAMDAVQRAESGHPGTPDGTGAAGVRALDPAPPLQPGRPFVGQP